MRVDILRIARLVRIAASPRAILHSLARADVYGQEIDSFREWFEVPAHINRSISSDWENAAVKIIDLLPMRSNVPYGKQWQFPTFIASDPDNDRELEYLENTFLAIAEDHAARDAPQKFTIFQVVRELSEGFVDNINEFLKLVREFNSPALDSWLKKNRSVIESAINDFEKKAEKLRQRLLGAPSGKLDMRYYHGK